VDKGRICERDEFIVVVEVVMWTCRGSGSSMEIGKVIRADMVRFGLDGVGSLELGGDKGVDDGANVAVVDDGLVITVDLGRVEDAEPRLWTIKFE
jgi:hypothetical protein